MGAHVPIPVYQGTVGERLAFEGDRCLDCEAVVFPSKAACPACGSIGEFESVDLSGDGTVYSYTVLSPGGAPPEFADEARIEGEYVVALVELAEGPRITAQLTAVDPSDVEIGLPVTGRIRRIYEEEGVVRYGFKFAPR
jgi:uncharacterized OB-fold protein